MASADTKRTARRTLVVIGLLLVTALLVFLVMKTSRVLVWIVIAAFFAVALNPAVNVIERKISWVRRSVATLLVYVVVVIVIAGIVALFVIPLIREGAQLADQFPQIVADVKAGRGPIGHLSERFHIVQYIESHSGQIRGYVSNLGGPTLAVLSSAATTIVGLLTIFVLSYLMVLQAPKINSGFLALFDERRAERIRRVGADCARTVTGYLTGNLLISLIAGALTYVMLLILGVPYALLIALFVGIADLIPLVGATLGAVVAIIAGFTQSVTAGVILIIFFVVYQQVENHLLQPVILSRTVQLNALTVLIAILVAAELAGILGALLAIPIAGMIQIIVRDVWDERRGRLKEEPTVGDDEVPADRAKTTDADTATPRPSGVSR